MEELFLTQPTNSHKTLLFSDPEEWLKVSGGINKKTLLVEWRPLNLVFFSDEKKTQKTPDICPTHGFGVIAFRADLKSSIFPTKCDGLEFLPITVEGVPWLLTNCLQTVGQIDEKASEVFREGGEIFMILNVCVTDPSANEHEIFTLAQSNRAYLFVRPSFKKRIEQLGLEGINFQRIGSMV